MGSNILVIDDEKEFLSSVRRALITAGYKKITLVSDPREVTDLLQDNEPYDIAIIDITMPNISGLEVLSLIKNLSPFTECIMVTARNEARLAVDCLKKGAYDYLVKPINAEDFLRVVGHAVEKKHLLDLLELSKKNDQATPVELAAFRPIITRSAKMFNLLREAELHARSDMPVLISGETGTGKELLARAIHAVSSRAAGPFTPINMGSLSENLFESAFFGHVKGAFTGAHNSHTGFLEVTHGGTLFLDEIGTLPMGLQGMLLRVLQEKEFITLGTNKPRSVDVRFVAATNAELQTLMAEGRFRKDLYYRLRGAQLHLPPLRDRKEDIPLLIDSFLKEFRPMGGRPEIPEEVMARLVNYDYPGNIRELRAIIQSAMNLAQGEAITTATLPADIAHLPLPGVSAVQKTKANRPIVSISAMEKELIKSTLEDTGGNLTHSAKRLEISLNTLRRKITAYGIGKK